MSTRKKALKETYLPAQFAGAGQEGLSLPDLCKAIIENGDTLTFDERFLDPKFKKPDYLTTPFKEVKNIAMSGKVPDKYKGILDEQKIYAGTFDEFVNELKQSIKKYLVRVWNSKKQKLFLHSAGYDSRIISGCIMELKEERGDDWLGPIHFRCHQPEGEMFVEIMKRQGWSPEQYSLWEDTKGPENHYNLGRLEPVNGFMGVVQQYDFFSDLVDKYGAENIVMIGGIYGGEMFDYPSRAKKHFKAFKYCDNKWLRSLGNYMLYEGGTVTKYFNDHAYAIFPYLSFEYLKVATTCPNKFVTRDLSKGLEWPDDIRLAILKSFEVDLVNIPYGRHKYTWNITPERWDEMRDFYLGSKFYKYYFKPVSFPFKLNSHGDKLFTFALMYEYIYNEL
jgi:hypothetical protein